MRSDNIFPAASSALRVVPPDTIAIQCKKAICDFCLANIFEPDLQANRPKSDHHTECERWITSVLGSCMICILLLEHIRTAVHELEDEGVEQKRYRPGKAEDKRIRATTGEELLVEWFKTVRRKLEISYPLYKSHIQDAGGREAWRVKFEPVAGSLTRGGLSVALRKQNFLIYAADCEVFPKA
jgi:hypothetical protein